MVRVNDSSSEVSLVVAVNVSWSTLKDGLKTDSLKDKVKRPLSISNLKLVSNGGLISGKYLLTISTCIPLTNATTDCPIISLTVALVIARYVTVLWRAIPLVFKILRSSLEIVYVRTGPLSSLWKIPLSVRVY